MDDRLKESISALMDDEANELELQRVLSQLEQDDVQSVWASYHEIRDAVKSESEAHFSIDIRAGVAAAISDEEQIPYDDKSAFEPVLIQSDTLLDNDPESNTKVNDQGSKRSANAWYAVAASVVLAVLFSVQGYYSSDVQTLPVVAENSSNSDEHLLKAGVNSVVASAVTEEPIVISQLDPQQARLLSRYLLRHAEHAVRGTQSGFVPLARVASVNSVGI